MKSIFYFHLLTIIVLAMFCNSSKRINENNINIPDHENERIQSEKPVWSDIAENSFAKKGGRTNYVKLYRTIKLDTNALNKILAQDSGENISMRNTKAIISLPLPGGAFARFRFMYAPTMADNQDNNNKSIRTYIGQGADDEYMAVSFDMTTEGFHAMITQENNVIYIEPYYKKDLIHYICYYKHDINPGKRIPFEEKGPIKY